jgi:DNA replication protein DnaC
MAVAAPGFRSLGSDARRLKDSIRDSIKGSSVDALASGNLSTRTPSVKRPTTATPSGSPPSAPSSPPVAPDRSSPIEQVDVCPGCHGSGWYHLDVPYGDPRFGQVFTCECQAEEIALRRARRAQAASDAAPSRCGFEDYDALYNPDALDAAREWAMGYAGPDLRQPGPFGNPEPNGALRSARPLGNPEPNGALRSARWSPWLLLHGSYGTGKTMLLASAFYALLDGENGGRAPIYTVAPLLLDHIRDGIGRQAGEYGERFYAVRDCPLLILDDLGAESRTAWADETLFKLIDYRYRLRLPLAIATNLALDELEPRLASRVQDRRIARSACLTGPDWRLR